MGLEHELVIKMQSCEHTLQTMSEHCDWTQCPRHKKRVVYCLARLLADDDDDDERGCNSEGSSCATEAPTDLMPGCRAAGLRWLPIYQ